MVDILKIWGMKNKNDFPSSYATICHNLKNYFIIKNQLIIFSSELFYVIN